MSEGRHGRLAGLTAVVTGAGRGIGRAIATRYAAEGATVVCAARSRDEIEACADTIRSEGGRALAVEVDVTVDSSVDALAAVVRDEVGVPDVLVNNAGVLRVGRFVDLSVEAWQHVLDVNVLGAVRVTRAFLPGMMQRGSGRVVNMASTAGKYGSVNQSPYNASKHAVVGLTRCLALETASSGVRVNAICPGFVATDIVGAHAEELAALFGVSVDEVEPLLTSRVPIGRMLEPDEVAELAVYLAAPESDGMTGQSITLAGGLILV